MRVFLSSTVYDLIDVRSELAEHLRAMGVAPVLSDDKLSDFQVPPDANSIVTCLLNVERCGLLILILDKRYGPKLDKAGFDPVSATHLEYRHALKVNVPVKVYVRDRLAADFQVWKDNKEIRDSLTLPWVASREDWNLFGLIDEHRKLRADSVISNWYDIFTNSTDLKAAITNLLGPELLPSRIVEAIQSNSFPVFRATARLEHQYNAYAIDYVCKVEILNAGGGAAFDFKAYWRDDSKDVNVAETMPPGQEFVMTFKGRIGRSERVDQTLVVEYLSSLGVLVRDTFDVAIDARDGDIRYGCPRISREYFRGELPRVIIQEAGR